MAVDAGVGLIVIDNTDDIDRLEALVKSEQPVLVRVIPGVRPDTHEAVATGQAGSKFGLPIPAARAAIARLRHSDRLRLDGVHVHIGSQIMSTEPYAQAVEAIAALGDFAVYNLGGGLGVRYTYARRPPSPEDWIEALTDAARRHLPRDAQLIIEPGRSLVAPFGVTVYRVISVKGDDPRFVAVDGGMADNMEVALYGQRFEATHDQPGRRRQPCRAGRPALRIRRPADQRRPRCTTPGPVTWWPWRRPAPTATPWPATTTALCARRWCSARTATAPGGPAGDPRRLPFPRRARRTKDRQRSARSGTQVIPERRSTCQESSSAWTDQTTPRGHCSGR